MPEQTVEIPKAISKEKAPSSELKIATVIPVYKEYDNGNVFRLLDAFRKQTLSKDKFELVFVVNSPSNDEKGIKEGEKTIRLLNFIKGEEAETEGFFETEKQRKIAQKAKEQGLSVIAVDLVNNPPPEEERNIGFFRDLGTKIAIERLNKTKAGLNGIVMQFDADTLIPRQFLEGATQRFAANPDLQVLFPDFYYFPPSETTETGMRLRMDWEFCWHLKRMYSAIDGKSELKGGSQIIARAQAIKEVGNIPHEFSGEDVLFATSLVKRFPTQTAFDPHLITWSIYRARPESFSSGELTDLQKWLKGEEKTPLFLKIWQWSSALSSEYDLRRPKIAFASRELKQVIGQYEEPRDHIEEIITKGQEIFAKYKVPFEKETLENQLKSEMYGGALAVWAYLTSLKDKGVNFQPSSISEYTQELKAVLKENISPEETNALEKSISQSLSYSRIEMMLTRTFARKVVEKWYANNLSNEEKQFLEKNPWLEKSLDKRQKEEQIWRQLVLKYPEVLGERETASKRQGVAVVRGVVSFLETVKRNPKGHPKAWSWMQKVRKSS